MKLDHIQLAIPPGAEDACRAFWTGLLGCRELETSANLRARGGVWFLSGDIQINLGVQPDFTPEKKAHPAFLVPDTDPSADRLATAGHPIKWDNSIPDRCRFFAEDPVGNPSNFWKADQ